MLFLSTKSDYMNKIPDFFARRANAGKSAGAGGEHRPARCAARVFFVFGASCDKISACVIINLNLICDLIDLKVNYDYEAMKD